ncbi:S1 family peptidase [Nocardia sp. CC227C]|uniref:S1 family peptidase n=1 Tax=Nocardia sp. CC227C TaxID=3044562 RepID=UPI00278BBCA8|nr:S1 family peptidase [Nocardia sp. CC227C]
MRRRFAVASLVGAALVSVAGVGTAAADPAPAVLGGSSGIILNTHEACSLTAIGYDAAGRLVGLTAGHCAAAGSPVRAEQSLATGVLGTVVFSDLGQDLDYAVIEFDPAKVAPVRTVGQTTIAGVGAPPAPGVPVCSSGRSSGFDCGVVWGAVGNIIVNQSCSIPGDSGGPVTVGDRLVGMNQGHVTPFGIDMQCVTGAFPVHSPAYFRPIADILRAVNANGGVGAGLRPV